MLKNTSFFGLKREGGTFESLVGAFWAALAACTLPSLVQAQTVSYAAPIVITHGGTYTGNYRSDASAVPCVRVATTEAVVLDGCRLTGPGNLVEAGEGADLTVRNCRGQGLAPTVDNQAPGHFLDTYRARRLAVEHNYFAQTGGIVVNRWGGSGAPGQTLTVRYNQARNLDGRWRNGGSTHCSFLLLNTVQHLVGADIAYNEVINTPDQSLVEDNLNFYNSSGTARSPLRAHDNFVRGAYPFPAAGGYFTGTGLTTDGDAQTADGASAYIEADHNQFVATGNAAMNLAAGHDIYYHDNRAVTSGLLPGGHRFNATNAGLGVFNFYHQPAGAFGNNRVENNTVGYVNWGSADPLPDRQDLSAGACAPCAGTQHLPNPITLATEDNEAVLWQQKLQQAGVTVGPAGAPTTPTAPAAPTAPPVAGNNLVANPGFEADGAAVGDPTGWQTWAGANTDNAADYTETFGGAHTGAYHGTHFRPDAFEVYTYQVLQNLPAGTYALRAWVKSSGGQAAARMLAKNYGGAKLVTDLSATIGTWTLVEVKNIAVTNGQCEIGFYSKAQGRQSLYFDDVEFVRQNAGPAVVLTATASLTLGQPLALSANAVDSDGTIAKVEFFSGGTKLGEDSGTPYQLSWTPTAVGAYSLTARATDNTGASTTSAPVVAVVVALPTAPAAPPVAGGNPVANPGFEADGAAVGAPTGWQTTTGSGTSDNADYTETYPGAHGGLYHGTHYRPEAYEVYTYQVLKGLPAGTYTLRAWVKSSGGQAVAQMQAKTYGGTTLATNIAATAGSWALVELRDIAVGSNGKCEIGFYSKAQGGQSLYFDDVELVAQSTAPPAANTVLNASFDDDGAPVQAPSQWSTQTWGTTQAYASYTESYGGARTGAYHGTHYRPEDYEVYTYQVVKNLPAGTYALRAWVRSSGGQPQAQVLAKNYGGASLATNIQGTTGAWTLVEVKNITVTSGQCEIGLYSKAQGGQSLYFDDVELARQDGGSASAAVSRSVADVAHLTLYPNPADDQVAVSANFAQASAVVLVVIDLQGTTVARSEQQAIAGDNQFTINTSNLPDGLYSVQVQSSQATLVQRLEVRH